MFWKHYWIPSKFPTKLNKTLAGPLACWRTPTGLGIFRVWSKPVCDVPGTCVCVPCMPTWCILRMHFLNTLLFMSWKDIAGFHRLCTLLHFGSLCTCTLPHSEWLGTHVPYVLPMKEQSESSLRAHINMLMHWWKVFQKLIYQQKIQTKIAVFKELPTNDGYIMKL